MLKLSTKLVIFFSIANRCINSLYQFWFMYWLIVVLHSFIWFANKEFLLSLFDGWWWYTEMGDKCSLPYDWVSFYQQDGLYIMFTFNFIKCLFFSLWLSDNQISEFLGTNSMGNYKSKDLTTYVYYLFLNNKTPYQFMNFMFKKTHIISTDTTCIELQNRIYKWEWM